MQNVTDQEWALRGVDISIIRDNLKLTYEERLLVHQNTLDFVDELKQQQTHCAKPSQSSQITGS
ncbi:hypothetical protein K1X76_12430 [bacterium]|nr:hypothetical protein [bacterium]